MGALANRLLNRALQQRCEDCGTQDLPIHQADRASARLCFRCERERQRPYRGVRDLEGIRRLLNQLRG